LGPFEAEVRSILDGQRPQLVHVLYFDAAVQRVETYQAGQPVSLSPVGGGGTDFRPCFDWLQEKGIMPQTLVFLTDLCGTFPSEVPSVSGDLGVDGGSESAFRASRSNGGCMNSISNGRAPSPFFKDHLMKATRGKFARARCG
jgi:hypothetical protein